MNDDFRRMLKPPPSWDEGVWLVDLDRCLDDQLAEPLWQVLLRNNGVELEGPVFRACGKPDCERAVPEGIVHCCTPCAVAAEGRYEIDQHAQGCDERWGARKSGLERLVT